jgi:hypothetical protein
MPRWVTRCRSMTTPAVRAVGAASLLWRNHDRDFPAWAGRDLTTHDPTALVDNGRVVLGRLRALLHASVGQQDTEFAGRGHALEVVDGDLRRQCVERQDLNQVTIADDQVVFERGGRRCSLV